MFRVLTKILSTDNNFKTASTIFIKVMSIGTVKWPCSTRWQSFQHYLRQTVAISKTMQDTEQYNQSLSCWNKGIERVFRSFACSWFSTLWRHEKHQKGDKTAIRFRHRKQTLRTRFFPTKSETRCYILFGAFRDVTVLKITDQQARRIRGLFLSLMYTRYRPKLTFLYNFPIGYLSRIVSIDTLTPYFGARWHYKLSHRVPNGHFNIPRRHSDYSWNHS